jgi:exopolysaccharide biosynthesis protein
LFSESKYELRVVAQGPLAENGKPLSELLKSSGAVAGVNGGYFKAPKLLPAGLEISRGKSEGEVWRGNPLVGSCLVRNGVIKLEWDAEWRGTEHVTELLQCSPWLVSGGQTAKGISAPSSPRLRRTFIATDEQKNWVLGTCESMTLTGLASMLASQSVITELKITRALNLDGGPSTGLWCMQSDHEEHCQKEFWKVRNAIAILVRE